MSRALWSLFCLGLGVVLGALGMRAYLDRTAAPATPAPVAVARDAAPARVFTANAPAVWVTLQNGVDARRVPAVVLSEPAVILLRFDDFVMADRGYWQDASGQRHDLNTAVAINLPLGLLAFAHDGQGAPPLPLSDDDGSLFLGLDVEMHTPVSAHAAFV
ncbi:MAG: hypothetical protein AAFU65_08020, partial [Pseudomonadota bacterium]